ncbi:chromosome partitioning protein [Streptomyces fuscichromogenes]|uniref:Chromosome partitioning protein n=1 Tax=Streptomyces fuscichromogenes TaxID=1324013 RepID=A0A917XMT9_9ACTN|nr:chromosome partitioning protein [Streptomyces fuscichromogenes]GGN40777.1 hypothetical protein GCM10011578_088420 [Streptomyces fuscichromogenes]
MTGVEIAVGYAFAWLVRKAKRVAGPANAEVDRGLDAAMGQLHDLISARLGADPALERAGEEAGEGRQELSERTRRRLTDSLEDAAERDTVFAEALGQLVEHLESLHGAGAGGDHVDFRQGTFHGPVQGKGVQHITYGKAPE